MKNELLYTDYYMYATYSLNQFEREFEQEQNHEELAKVREAITYRKKYNLT